MSNYALFIGNGLNRASDNKAWIDMVDEIRLRYTSDASIPYSNLPLEFERIYLDAKKQGTANKAYDLKLSIIHYIPKVKELDLHIKFTSLPIENFITSNYDYYIEKSIDSTFNRSKLNSHTKELKHSLFRYINVDQKKVWHMHGEMHCPESICLGYDQYCTYLSKVISYLTQPYPGLCTQPLLRFFLSGGEVKQKAWPLLFFTHNIFILGITLSFIEIDLWWLLCYRMRFILENPQYNIANRLHYYYVANNRELDDDRISLLESVGVKLHPIPLVRNNWKKLYFTILANIDEIIKKEGNMCE